ncbi:MAG: TetR/AcrR family transcriptional regulator [Myxococcales bacterium]
MSNDPTRLQGVLAAFDQLNRTEEATDAKGRTRARLLRAATRLFQKNGYRKTSVDDVAREAGVAKGTVYVHFKNKSELLFHAIAEEKKQLVAPFRALFSEPLDPRTRLQRYFELMFNSIPLAPLGSRLMSGDREMLTFLEELPEALRAQVLRTQADALQALLTGVGEFDRLSPAERTARMRAVLGILYSAGALLEERVRGGLSIEEYARQLAKILVDGIGAP